MTVDAAKLAYIAACRAADLKRHNAVAAAKEAALETYRTEIAAALQHWRLTRTNNLQRKQNSC